MSAAGDPDPRTGPVLDAQYDLDDALGQLSVSGTATPRTMPSPYEIAQQAVRHGDDLEYPDDYTVTSSSTSSSIATSTFSRRSHSTSRSSAPPTASWHRPLDQDIGAQGPARNQYRLPCEFTHITGCRRTFASDELEAWISHHINHMGPHCPEECRCWYCDDYGFNASKTAQGDRQYNFVLRMQHIHGHIQFDQFSMAQIRPDYPVLKHMRKHGLIDPAIYDEIIQYSELPAAYRLPKDRSSHDRRQPRQQGNIVDLEKERRRERKEKKDEKKDERGGGVGRGKKHRHRHGQ